MFSLASSLKCACASELPGGLPKTVMISPTPEFVMNKSLSGSSQVAFLTIPQVVLSVGSHFEN